ncbi:MAG: lipopolysaccharide biosynthesis protein [Phormidesmis sp.]
MKRSSLIDRHFLNNVFFNYGSQLIIISAGFIRVTLSTRHAGIAVYGMVATAVALSAMLTNLMTFRTNEAVIAFYKRGQSIGDPNLCYLSLVAGLCLDLAIGGLLCISVVALSSFIADFILKDIELRSGVVILGCAMFANFLRGAPAGLMVAEERFRLINSLQIIEALLKLLILLYIVISNISMTFDLVIVSTLIPAVVVTGIMYYHPIAKLIGPLRRATIPKAQLKDYFRFTTSTFLSSTLKAANLNIDTVLLSALTNPVIVGSYDILKQFLSPLSIISGPFSSQITPRFVEAVTRKEPDIIRETIKHTNLLLTRLSILVIIVMTPAVLAYSQWNGLNFTRTHYIAFSVLALSTITIRRMWWCRAFSVSTNPKISVQSGIISSFVLPISVVIFASLVGGLIGTAIGMLINSLVLTWFWSNKLKEAF